VFHATVPEGCILYVPASYVFAERTSAQRTLGLRLGIVAATDTQVPARLKPILEHRRLQGGAATMPGSHRLAALISEVAGPQ
jgi:hypothetical protein